MNGPATLHPAHRLAETIGRYMSALINHAPRQDAAIAYDDLVAALEPLFAAREPAPDTSSCLEQSHRELARALQVPECVAWPVLIVHAEENTRLALTNAMGSAAELATHAEMCRALRLHESNTWAGLIRHADQNYEDLQAILKDGNARLDAADARIHELEARLADAEKERDAARARSMNLESDIANREYLLAAAIADKKAADRVDTAQLASICDALEMEGGEPRSWGTATEILRALVSQVENERRLVGEGMHEIGRARDQLAAANMQIVSLESLNRMTSPIIDASFPTLPPGYRIAGTTVTNDTITVDALDHNGTHGPEEAIIIRTAAGVAIWAPLDAVKIAIAEKEKTK